MSIRKFDELRCGDFFSVGHEDRRNSKRAPHNVCMKTSHAAHGPERAGLGLSSGSGLYMERGDEVFKLTAKEAIEMMARVDHPEAYEVIRRLRGAG